jgi:PelA/Pel-15E family pectate lyase
MMGVANAACGSASATAADQTETPGVLPPYQGTLLASARLSALAPAARQEWEAYLLASRSAMAADQQRIQGELRTLGSSSVRRPPNTASDFTWQSQWTAAWAASPAGRALISTVRSFQTASGGWGKHIDYAQGPRQPGMGYNSESDEWAYVGTIDNSATVTEMRLLALVAASDSAAASAFDRGLSYLLQAQFPSGCWPQVFPLMGSYHDAATHNDDAMVGVLRLLRDVSTGRHAFVVANRRTQVTTAVERANACLVSTQVMVDGVRTTWAQQHDPITGAPVIGRSYELPGLAGREGARVLDVLMEDPAPSSAVTASVHAAAAWYRRTAIPNVVYVADAGLVASQGNGPLWPRITDISSGRAVFANRDGIPLYDYALLTDRRSGYAWYSAEPASSLSRYTTWARTHPQQLR